MRKFFGITKIIISILLLLLSAVLLLQLFGDGSRDFISNSLAFVATGLYGISLLYSGVTQLKNLAIKMPYLIWFSIAYGLFCCAYYCFIVGSMDINSTLLMGLIVLAITVDDAIRITKRV